MGEIEADILHSYHDTSTCEGTMLWSRLVDRQNVVDLCHCVECHVSTLVGLYTQYGGFFDELANLRYGNGDNADITQLGIDRATILYQLLIGKRLAGLHEDGGQPVLLVVSTSRSF